jgi:hypothetical protein
MTLTESIEDPARGGFREALFYEAECSAVLLMHGVFCVPVRSASLRQTVNCTCQSSQRRGSPFQERIATQTASIPNISPKPSNGCWLSLRSNGDKLSKRTVPTPSANQPCQVCATLWPKRYLGPYQYRSLLSIVASVGFTSSLRWILSVNS